AKAFGMPTAVIDGNDPEVSYAALSKAMDYVRTERRPYMLEAMVSRLRGHSSASGANLVKGEIDCVLELENKLEERRVITRSQIDLLRTQYTQELLEASQRVVEEPAPTAESAWDYVFADKNYVAGES
ncbi:MAG: thiamine pyrophosphate-dependent dehydrogenase E1 component subunit alpha, partial [Deltaproteobacteria bacterium]|nr:thiamine pyrophosphate-dependent dehydrogenase E1 component subunit alpha [Deltaproteobacteria bacterium]